MLCILLKRWSNANIKAFFFQPISYRFIPTALSRRWTSKLPKITTPIIIFRPNTIWHQQVLVILNELTQLEQQKDDFYCYDVLYRLFSIWQLILKNNVPQKKSFKNLAALRTQQFLQYIECHYHESLTLNRLAASAHVSSSECLRCFKHTLQTTPYKCLMNYRL